jgi:hypothetical protein
MTPTMDAIDFSTINGLPAHILIVHVVVILVPLAAVALVAAMRPSIARRLGIALPGLAAVALLSVFAAMNAGSWLEHHVDDSGLVHKHTEIAGTLWPFSLAVLILSVVVWWLGRRTSTDAGVVGTQTGGVLTSVIVGVLALAMAVVSVVQVVRIGESGSRAAWHNNFSHDSVSDNS